MCGAYKGAGIEIMVLQLQELLADAMRASAEWEQYASGFETKPELVRRTDIVPVVTARGILPMRWGFTRNESKEVIPHARWETVLERTMFRNAVKHNRCLVPSFLYYEKQFQFWPEGVEKGRDVFLMAGIYRQTPGQTTPEFAVITRDAAPHIHHIHDRMPIILSMSNATQWLSSHADIIEVLRQAILNVRFEQKPQVSKKGPEQISMFS